MSNEEQLIIEAYRTGRDTTLESVLRLLEVCESIEQARELVRVQLAGYPVAVREVPDAA